MTEFGPRYILGTSKGENTIISNVRYESPLFGNGWLNAAGTYDSVDGDTGVSTPPPPSQPFSLLSWHTWMCVCVCAYVCMCVSGDRLTFFFCLCVCVCVCVYVHVCIGGLFNEVPFTRPAVFFYFLLSFFCSTAPFHKDKPSILLFYCIFYFLLF
jgi:hypothetical protein